MVFSIDAEHKDIKVSFDINPRLKSIYLAMNEFRVSPNTEDIKVGLTEFSLIGESFLRRCDIVDAKETIKGVDSGLGLTKLIEKYILNDNEIEICQQLWKKAGDYVLEVHSKSMNNISEIEEAKKK